LIIFDQKIIVGLQPQLLSHIFTKIVFKPLRTNLFHIVFLAFFLTMNCSLVFSQDIKKKNSKIPAKIDVKSNQKTDLKTTEINLADLVKVKDSTKKDTLKTKKAFLEAKIIYKATDYAKIEQKKKLITLYNNAELYYQDVELKSGIIVMDYDKSEVYAGRIKDSVGKFIQYPNFKQGSNIVEPDSIRFNFKTKKALVWNSRTEQGEFKIKAGISKRENDSVYFMKGARFTTAKDIEDPEYYFQTNKLKFVPGKKVVVGPTGMVIAGVPTPIILPFAFFPMDKETRASGIIIPTFADNNERGFSLQNGGYYFNLTDNYDLAILGDYFTSGGYSLRAESNYAKRYKFRGNFNLRYENQLSGERGFANYSKTKIYNIQWSHSRDGKSNPNSNFSASVNLGSSKFFQQSVSQSVIGSRLNNNLSSSVSFSQRFNSVPQVNLSLTATHSQNSQTESISMTLPTLQLNVDQIFPFAPKDGVKKGFFKNINLQYSLNGRNEIVTTDSLFFTPKMFKDAKIGFQHSIPLSTNFKVFKYFSASTSATYNEVWALKTIRKNYDANQAKVVTTEVNGFDAFRTYNFNASLNTTVYGTFKFGDKKRIQAIRHLLKPSISYSYQPSFEKYYDSYAVDALGNKKEFYTRFEGGINGVPGNIYSSSIGLSIANTFEAKVRDQDSTKTEAKKVMLLNNLSVATNYDIVTKLFAPITLQTGTQLFDSKLGVNIGAVLNPYAIDKNGNLLTSFNKDNGGSLFRLTSANLTMNYSLSSTKEDDNKKKDDANLRNGGRNDDLFGKSQDLNNRPINTNEEDEKEDTSTFFNSKIPWNLTLAYSLTYDNQTRNNTFSTNSLMFAGNIDLTPKWKIAGNSGFDLVRKKLTTTSFSLERDLLSWRMSFNWVPFGDYTSWGFFIGIKSSALSDIKYDRNKLPDPRLR
jgi:lipopolysaccharide assembly outer membrane protein LptD (OstA)